MKNKHISLVVLVVIIYGLDGLSTDQNVIVKAKRQMCIGGGSFTKNETQNVLPIVKRQMCVGGGSCSSDRANNYNHNYGKRDVAVVTENKTQDDLPKAKRQMCVGGGSCSSDRANNYNYNYGKRDVAEVVTNETNDLLKVKRSASPEKVIKDLIPNQNSKRYADRFNNNNNPNVAGSYCDCDDQGQRCNCWNGK
ncbi:unnamed protein product [Brachionus calyciflorus]|uniref:Uncharacterized protein n=1 Tax=Brachionus calyciflorus TaxID=104777 RepID=A0A814J801_9BILA|nr:unnamed protein product [Brachionus calyciflorus]